MRTLLIAACFLLATTTPLLADSTWLNNYDAAVKESKSTGKPILVNFTGSDWCRWCVKLHQEVFSKADFKTWARKNVVLLELDFPRKKTLSAKKKAHNQELKKKYGVRGFPTVLILDSDGNKMGKTGYLRGGPVPWVKNADSLIAAHNNPDSNVNGNTNGNASGQKIKGKLISRTDEEIIIETEDGRRIRIPAKNIKVKNQ